MTATIEQFLGLYRDRVLPVVALEARAAAALRIMAVGRNRNLHLAVAHIAETARTVSLTVANRNAADFTGFGVAVHDPWAGR